jgi:tetratricopeptide (TPR) repeat protein
MIRNSILVLFFTSSLSAKASPQLDFALGVLAESRGKLAEAAPYFEKARLADPQALPLVQRAVRAKLASGDRASAVKLYRDLAATRLADLSIQLTYADFLTEQSRGDTLATQLAVDVLEAVLKKHPKHPQIIRRLFQQAQAAGNESCQVELLGQLAADEPASVLLYASLSKSLSDTANPATRETLDQRFLDALGSHPEIRELARAAF